MIRQTLTATLALATLFAAGCGTEEEFFLDESDYAGDESLLEGEGALDEAAFGELEQPLLGSDACKDVDIRITNSFEDGNRQARILVLSIEFYSSSEGRYISEDLANAEIAYGSNRWWYNEDLQYLENDTITQVRVHFKYRESDGDWSDEVTQVVDIPNDVCRADDDYHVTLD